MALKIKFGGDKELKDNNQHHWSKLTAGTNDLVLEGTHKEAVSWLYKQNLPVTCSEGFGNFIFIIVRGKTPRLSEQILGPVAKALELSPVGLLASCGASLPSAVPAALNTAQEIVSALGGSSSIGDYVDGKIEEKCTKQKVVVHISSSKGCFANHGKTKNMMVRLPAGLSSRFSAGGLASLQV